MTSTAASAAADAGMDAVCTKIMHCMLTGGHASRCHHSLPVQPLLPTKVSYQPFAETACSCWLRRVTCTGLQQRRLQLIHQYTPPTCARPSPCGAPFGCKPPEGAFARPSSETRPCARWSLCAESVSPDPKLSTTACGRARRTKKVTLCAAQQGRAAVCMLVALRRACTAGPPATTAARGSARGTKGTPVRCEVHNGRARAAARRRMCVGLGLHGAHTVPSHPGPHVPPQDQARATGPHVPPQDLGSCETLTYVIPWLM